MFLECFIGLTEVTKESCCYGYPVTKGKKHGKWISRGMSCTLFYWKQKGDISNISKERRVYSVFLFFFFAKLGIKIQLHPFWLKQVIWQNAFVDLIRAMFVKMAVTQLIMGLSEKFSPTWPPDSPLSGKYHYFIPPKGPGSNGNIIHLS